MEILPGKGWSQIRFGMKRSDVEKLIGKPDEIELDSEDQLEYLHYDEAVASLTFDGTEDGKLSTIVIADGDSTLFNEPVFEMDPESIKKLLKTNGCKNISIEGENDKVLEAEELEMLFWFEKDELMEVQWGPFFADEDQIIWPT